MESCGEHMIEAVTSDDVEVVGRDQATVSDDTDRPHREALLQVGEHARERGDVGGVAGEDVMGDRHPIAGAQQPDDDLRAITAMVPAVAEGARWEPLRGSC